MFINTNLKDIHPHNAYGIYNNLDISWYHQPLIAHPAGHGGGALEPRPLRRGGEEGFPRLWRPPTSVESSGDLGLGIPIKPKWWLLASVFWGFGSQMVGYGGVMCENGGCKLYPRKNGFVFSHQRRFANCCHTTRICSGVSQQQSCMIWYVVSNGTPDNQGIWWSNGGLMCETHGTNGVFISP